MIINGLLYCANVYGVLSIVFTNIVKVESLAFSLNANLSFLTSYVILGFLEAFPYIGFINFIPPGNILPIALTMVTKKPPMLFLIAGAIIIAPSNKYLYFKVK